MLLSKIPSIRRVPLRVAFVFAAALSAAWSAPAIAHAQGSPLERYRAEALDLRITAFGLTGFDLRRGGVLVDNDYAAVFTASPAALAEFHAYDSLMTTGKVFFYSGIAIAVTGLIVIAVDSKPNDISVPGVGLAIGGVVAELTGGILISVGRLRINDAVQKYNDDLFRRLQASPEASRNLSLLVGSHF
jgi:hypothetical protein